MSEYFSGVARPAALALASIFAFAVISKLRTFSLFREQLAEFDLVPVQAVPILAQLTVGFEGVVVLLLVARPELGAIISIALLTTFDIVLVSAITAGRSVACGCFGGQSKTAVSWHDVFRNGCLSLLAFPSLVLSEGSKPGGLASLGMTIPLVLVIALLAETSRFLSVTLRIPAHVREPDPIDRGDSR